MLGYNNNGVYKTTVRINHERSGGDCAVGTFALICHSYNGVAVVVT